LLIEKYFRMRVELRKHFDFEKTAYPKGTDIQGNVFLNTLSYVLEFSFPGTDSKNRFWLKPNMVLSNHDTYKYVH
jgi:hypothetical protein